MHFLDPLPVHVTALFHLLQPGQVRVGRVRAGLGVGPGEAVAHLVGGTGRQHADRASAGLEERVRTGERGGAGSPDIVDQQQLDDLHIQLIPPTEG